MAGLRDMFPKSAQKKASTVAAVPRGPALKWKPVLGEPTVPTTMAAARLITQQRTSETEVESSLGPGAKDVKVDAQGPQMELAAVV